MEIVYSINLTRGVVKKILPDYKSLSVFPTMIKVESAYKEFEIKLMDDKPILSLNESVFYDRNTFPLYDYKTQITGASQLYLQIKHLSEKKDLVIPLNITITYMKLESAIIYSNTYNQTTPEGLATIMDELQSVGKYIVKIVWTSPEVFDGISFVPDFQSNPVGLFESFNFKTENNKIVQEVEGTTFINNLKYYKMILNENDDVRVKKLGVAIYGFH